MSAPTESSRDQQARRFVLILMLGLSVLAAGIATFAFGQALVVSDHGSQNYGAFGIISLLAALPLVALGCGMLTATGCGLALVRGFSLRGLFIALAACGLALTAWTQLAYPWLASIVRIEDERVILSLGDVFISTDAAQSAKISLALFLLVPAVAPWLALAWMLRRKPCEELVVASRPVVVDRRDDLE